MKGVFMISARGRWFTWHNRQESSYPPAWKSAAAAVAVITVNIIAMKIIVFFICFTTLATCPG